MNQHHTLSKHGKAEVFKYTCNSGKSKIDSIPRSHGNTFIDEKIE